MRREGPGLRVQLSSFDHPAGCRLEALLASHPFTHAVDLVLPVRHFKQLPSLRPAKPRSPRPHAPQLCTVEASCALQPRDSPFYYAAPLALAQLLEPGFAGDGLLALSCGPLDGCDALALTPDGDLHLSLTGESFARLGAAGRRAGGSPGACARRQPPPRFACRVPLRPGSAAHERLVRCAAAAPAPLPCLLARCDADGCSAPLALPGARRLPLELRSRLLAAQLPPLERAFGGDAARASAAAGDSALLASLAEWLGGLALGAVGRETGVGGAAAAGGWEWGACGAAEAWPAGPDAWLQHHRWRGLLAPAHAAAAVATARRAVARLGAPWAAVCLAGFRDAAVAWLPLASGAPPPPRAASGANDLMVLILPKERYLVMTLCD